MTYVSGDVAPWDLDALLANRNNLGRYIDVAGDSLEAGGYAGSAFVSRAMFASEGEFAISSNFAVGGKRSDEILAQQFPALLAGKNRIIVVGAGTNDIAQGFGGSSTLGDAAARANWQTYLSQARAAGKLLISVGMFPSSNGYVSDMARHELWRMMWARKNNVPHIHVWSSLAQPNGSYIAGTNLDSLHPNSNGADIAAVQTLKQLRALGKNAPFGELIDYATSTALLPNAVSFAGVASGLPSGYFSTGAGGTYSIVAPSDGSFGNWLKTSITGAATAVGWNGTSRTLANLGWAAGDKIAVGFRLKTVSSGEGTMQVTVTAQAGTSILFNEFCPITGDWWVYVETVLNTAAPLFKITANTTGAGTQEFWVQRPIIYNLTKNEVS